MDELVTRFALIFHLPRHGEIGDAASQHHLPRHVSHAVALQTAQAKVSSKMDVYRSFLVSTACSTNCRRISCRDNHVPATRSLNYYDSRYTSNVSARGKQDSLLETHILPCIILEVQQR